jgi:hypothetical protein
MMVSLLRLWHRFYGQPFLREQIISNLYWRAQLSEHFSVNTWLQTYSKLPLLRATSYRQPDTILKTIFFFFLLLKWQVLKIRVPKFSRKKPLRIFFFCPHIFGREILSEGDRCAFAKWLKYLHKM